MNDACMIPSSLSEPTEYIDSKTKEELIRLFTLQSDTMKKAIMDVMKATIGEYNND